MVNGLKNDFSTKVTYERVKRMIEKKVAHYCPVKVIDINKIS